MKIGHAPVAYARSHVHTFTPFDLLIFPFIFLLAGPSLSSFTLCHNARVMLTYLPPTPPFFFFPFTHGVTT